MQFIIDPAVMSGGHASTGSLLGGSYQPSFLLPPEAEKRRKLLQQAMQGQGSFENIFGTGPGAVKSVTTKKDVAGNQTVTHSFNTPPIEPIPSAKALEMAQSANIPGLTSNSPSVQNFAQQATPSPNLSGVEIPNLPTTAIMQNNPGFLGKIGNALSNPGVFGALGQIGAAIGGPGSFAERLGSFATNQARNQLFDRYLQQRLAGQGGAGSSAPFGVSGLGVGLLSPQEQLAATNQPLTELGALSDAAYKEALISGVETPEQLLNRQVLITMLGKEPGKPNAGSFQNIEVGPDGKRTPGITHKWLIDDVTGEPIKYQGVVGATNPVSSSERADQSGAWYQKAVNEAKLNVDREAAQYGKIQTDAFGNVTGIEWSDEDAPRRYQQSYYNHLLKAIKRFQTLGNLPANFSVPFEQEAAGFQQGSKPKY